MRRSRKGAWIEIKGETNTVLEPMVAPVRERGLKYRDHLQLFFKRLSRSRKGAWIEINSAARHAATVASRSRKGAWIEILKDITQAQVAQVAPVRERGLKSRLYWFRPC